MNSNHVNINRLVEAGVGSAHARLVDGHQEQYISSGQILGLAAAIQLGSDYALLRAWNGIDWFQRNFGLTELSLKPEARELANEIAEAVRAKLDQLNQSARRLAETTDRSAHVLSRGVGLYSK